MQAFSCITHLTIYLRSYDILKYDLVISSQQYNNLLIFTGLCLHSQHGIKYLIDSFYISNFVNGMVEKDLVLAIDVGTTNCRAAIINKEGCILKIAFEPIELLSPKEGWFEICPHKLWSDISKLILKVTKDFYERILTCGITVQRNTFITWRRDTGEYLHNFITWMDMRSSKLCSQWNNSYFINIGRWAAWMLGSVVRSRHMICASTFTVREKAIPMRLKWVMDNIKDAKLHYKNTNMCFGTIDSWLIWKLTKGRTWATDYSCASSTGIFDIWKSEWCKIMTYLFSCPIDILPEVRDSDSYYGDIDISLGFGFSAPINGVIGDQQASIFGNTLFNVGDMKLTLGTGIACNINTGKKTHPTSHDIYPLVGWKLVGSQPFYVAELLAASGGRATDWAVTSGLLEDISSIDSVARSVPTMSGLSFLPAFNGMDVPFKEPFAGTSLFGITLETKTSNIIRAILESQVFISNYVLLKIFERYGKPSNITIDGGSSQSAFITENIAQLSKVNIKRSECIQGSLMGASFMAGLGSGLYKSLDDIKLSVNLVTTDFMYCENHCNDHMEGNYFQWIMNAKKCVDWAMRLS